MYKEREDKHQEVLAELEDEYLANGIDPTSEFIWDGPSHWEKYLEITPRIVFLAMESHSGFHPSTPIKISGKFGLNIGKWASIIPDIDPTKENKFNNNPQEAYDSIAIVEVKKVDEDKQRAIPSDIKKFAWMGREFLKEQIKILSPHLVICCGTLEYYDIINNYSPEERLIHEKLIYSNGYLKCWRSDNKLVVDFYHPSGSSVTDEIKLELLKDFVKNDIVQSEYMQIISKNK